MKDIFKNVIVLNDECTAVIGSVGSIIELLIDYTESEFEVFYGNDGIRQRDTTHIIIARNYLSKLEFFLEATQDYDTSDIFYIDFMDEDDDYVDFHRIYPFGDEE